jgi:Trk K+ transport system NAD-binding subunit
MAAALAPIIGLLVLVSLTLLVNRIATAALTFTGMSREMARFQARSALSTVGFTTSESESMVNHPVRRRIVSTLMMVGNVGFVTIIATSLSSIEGLKATSEHGYELQVQLALLASGLAALWAIGMSKWVDDQLFRMISWALRNWTRMEVHDYNNLLQLGEGYHVTELNIEEGDWLVGKRLDALRLNSVGVNVLGIHRKDSSFVGGPVGNTYVRRGDRLIVYGAREAVAALDDGKNEPEDEVKHFRVLAEIQSRRDREGTEPGEGYCVSEAQFDEEDWGVGKKVGEVTGDQSKVSVLGVERADGEYIEGANEDLEIHPGDRVVLYGAREAMVQIQNLREKMLSEENADDAPATRQEERG